MWRLIGHRTKQGFLCDICDGVHGSMDELILHIHSHAVSRIEPIFLFGAIYGMSEEREAHQAGAPALGPS